jgi:hypothetical protein
MAIKPNSISKNDLSEAVSTAVRNITTLKEIKAVDASFASLPWPIVGFILRDADLKNASVSELNKLAGSVTKSLGPEKATAATFAQGGHIIVGFVADASFSVFKG